YGYNEGLASIFLGQSYRTNNENSFSATSGLHDQLSDYVGNVRISPDSRFDFDYRFRIREDDLAWNRHQLTGTYNLGRVSGYVNYIMFEQLTGPATSIRSQQLSYSIRTKMDDYWAVTFN